MVEGAEVVLVTCTFGEVGEISDPSLATPENLGIVRAGELAAAAAILGVRQRHVLAYRDSGMMGTPPNDDPRSFHQADLDEAAGRLVPAGGGRASERQKIDAYSLSRLDDLAPVFDDVYRAAVAQGLPAETLMSEYSPGQFEITLHHRDDALRAVDEAVMFKRLLRGVAARHGLVACFMAKPFAARAGSGLHVHMSVNDAQGRNHFASEDPAGTAALRHAIGGMKDTMAESMAVFAPNANSYRRFVSQSYAPTAPIWGINNRSVSLRVPAGPAASRHVEHRIAGADANLYLAVATVLAAAEHGMRHRLDPGPPVEGNGYAQVRERTLPATWHEALLRASVSSFLADALGADFLKVFLAIKQQECARFSAEVTELDYAWYLRS